VSATKTGYTFQDLQPQIKYVYSILDNWKFLSAAKVVEEQLDCDVNQLHVDLHKTNMNKPQYEMYQSAPYVQGTTAAGWVDFRIRLQYKSSELFGPTDEDVTSTNIMLPVWTMPQTYFDIYFRAPNRVVSTNPEISATDVVPDYKIRNVYMDATWISSPSLTKELKDNGFSATWEAFQYSQYTVPATAGGVRTTTQIPSSFQNVAHIMAVFQDPDQLTVVTDPERNHRMGDQVSPVLALNTRVNSRLRYAEDLTASDLYRELIKMHPSAAYATWINGEQTLINNMFKPGKNSATVIFTAADGKIAGSDTDFVSDFKIGDFIYIDSGTADGKSVIAPIVHIVSTTEAYVNLGIAGANIASTANWARLRLTPDGQTKQDTPYLFNTTHGVWCFQIARDYADKQHLSGFATSNATGSVVCEYALTDATNKNYLFRNWMSYARHFSVAPGKGIRIDR
jgi:hypothetical protein